MLNPQPAARLFAARLFNAAQHLTADLAQGDRITRPELNHALSAAFGDTSASGAWTQRDSFIAAEIALILSLRQPAPPTQLARRP